ncbi:trypsin-like peptidase domain-containing protein [Actinocrinis puniceicyclus]|uniref:Trypsin-like peptidase domain-containing protein n=1 Tax=Actinocrinis puniceicyclus TaxID=977794 RepID=A0A8J7WSL2_9ACTN|nr:trypsin-like peptidase domain-containing protein [Actinocrinis puniceicyclus]MBS2966005.1 trypsin-like peptidase domain-containing protein [Actinocrinis puniceicyclus]
MTETPDNRATHPVADAADSATGYTPPAADERTETGPASPESQPQHQSPSPYAHQAESAVPPATSQQAQPPLAPQPATPAQPAAAQSTEVINRPLESPAGSAPLPSTPVWGAPPQQPHPAAHGWGGPADPAATGGAPPNWAAPAPNGLPPYGSPESAVGGERRRPIAKLALVTAVLAGLIGGGLGAGITYAVTRDNSTTTTSLGGSTATGSSNGLNTGSANANQVTAAAAKILPSVVTISVTAADGTGDEGSGIIISSNGEILTNNHVVAAAATSGDSVSVTFGGGKITPAKIVGRDEASDLAVIQASGVSGLTAATLGDSSTLAIGQGVVAVGAPLGLSNTVTTGIISALNRPVTPSSGTGSPGSTNSVLDAIQTDASINPGNSGGPLVDLSGNVIGINSAIATASSGSLGGSQSGSIGLGFAIPVNQAKWIADELINKGKATHSLLGVSVTPPGPTATLAGAVVKTVSPAGAADKAGIKAGDVIVKVDDQQINSADALVAAIRSYKPGTTVTLAYVRNGQTGTAQVTLLPASS